MNATSPMIAPRTLALALASAAALAAPAANAAVTSAVDLNQAIPLGTTVLNIGGMTGVNVGNRNLGDQHITGSGKAKNAQSGTFHHYQVFGSDVTFDALAQGSVIDSSSGFVNERAFAEQQGQSNGTSVGYGPVTGGGSGLYGTYFEDGDGTTHFGWIDVTVSQPFNRAGEAFVATLNGWGYEDTAGASIMAGATADSSTPSAIPEGTVAAVPEPTSLALLAVGLLGLGVARRRASRSGARAL